MEKLPDWVLQYRKPSTEIKKAGNKYYLYEVHCRYNRETKKKWKESKYLGILVEGVGLIPKGGKNALMKELASGRELDPALAELAVRVERLELENQSLRAEVSQLKAAVQGNATT